MSSQLIARSADLQRLWSDGYRLEIRDGLLVIRDVPYVTVARAVERGVLVSELTTAGDITAAPSTHVIDFVGQRPCDATGSPLTQLIINDQRRPIGVSMVADFQFSQKPTPSGRYANYYDKVVAYVHMLQGPARVLDPAVSARVGAVVVPDDDSVFNYLDTATGRAGIGHVSAKLQLPRVAIVGLGGTGSYVLDLVAKTPVRSIHLFDGDEYLTHNAFRAPGASTLEQLRSRPNKAEYWRERYSAMRKHLIAHPYHLDHANAEELREMSFVFLCLDPGPAKRSLVECMEAFNINFIDVGLGVVLVDGALRGTLRVTTSSARGRDHFRSRVSLGGGATGNEYSANIQIADLNALNAALAVLKWKKLCGFYQDDLCEHHSTFSIGAAAHIREELIG